MPPHPHDYPARHTGHPDPALQPRRVYDTLVGERFAEAVRARELLEALPLWSPEQQAEHRRELLEGR